jgi:hypothetical protein
MIRTRQNTMVALAVTALATAGAMTVFHGSQVQAQGGSPGEMRGGRAMGGDRAMGSREMNGDRFVQMFEQATKKKLTASQKSQLKAAVEKRNRAMRAAQQEFQKSVTKITGVSSDQMRAAMRRNRPNGPGGNR